PVIYDFTGTGYICTYEPSSCTEIYRGEFTGIVVIDVPRETAPSDGAFDVGRSRRRREADETRHVHRDILHLLGRELEGRGERSARVLEHAFAARLVDDRLHLLERERRGRLALRFHAEQAQHAVRDGVEGDDDRPREPC